MKIGLDVPQERRRPHRWPRRRTSASEIGLPLRPAAQLHAGRHRRRHRLQPRGVRRASSPRGLELSPVGEVLVEESVIGWKEYELEVMRDMRRQRRHHLLDREPRPDGRPHRRLDHRRPGPDADRQGIPADARRRACAIIREIGVETGGSNIQFAINPATGRMIVIEMNPRVSRVQRAGVARRPGSRSPRSPPSWPSATRSTNCRTTSPARRRPASSRRSTTSSRRSRGWTFEKFPDADPTLTTQMKSVGETMAIGRTFKESLQKALRGLEIGRFGLGCDQQRPLGHADAADAGRDRRKLATPERRADLVRPLRVQGGHDGRGDPRPDEDRPVVPAPHPRARRDRGRARRRAAALEAADDDLMLRGQAARLLRPAARRTSGTRTEMRGPPRTARSCGVEAVFKLGRHLRRRVRGVHAVLLLDVRSAASTQRGRRGAGTRTRSGRQSGKDRDHDPRRRAEPHRPGDRVRLLLLPGRVRAARGRATRPSWSTRTRRPCRTDYDTSDHLFFEPLTVEDVLNICDRMKPDGRDRAVRRADAAEPGQARSRRPACRSSAPASTASTSPRTASGSSRLVERARACKQPPNGTATRPAAGAAQSPRRSATRCWSGRASCSAAGRWRSSTTSDA